MNRIFLILAIISNVCLVVTFGLGWSIEDAGSLAESARRMVTLHFLSALAAATLALLVHAVVLTYFMGTGRWIEETSEAYRLGNDARKANIQLKYKVIPGMVGCMTLIIVTGAFGAIADPASNASMQHAATIHFVLAASTLLGNIFVSVIEYDQIARNGRLVNEIIERVQQIRRDRGLDQPTETTPAST